MNNTAEMNKKYKGLAGFKVLWRIMRGQRIRYVFALIFLLLSAVFMMVRSVIVGVALDSLGNSSTLQVPVLFKSAVQKLQEMAGGSQSLSKYLGVFALATVIAVTISGIFNYLRGVWAAKAAEKIARRLKHRLYDKLQHLPKSYFDDHDTGDLIQRSTSDVETVRVFLAAQVVEILRGPIMFCIAVPILWQYDRTLTLISVCMLPVIISFTIIFFTKIQKSFKAQSEAEGAMTARLQENISGIRVVRAFGRSEYEIERFAEANDNYRRRWWRLMQLFSFFWSTSDLLSIAQNVLVISVGVYFLSLGPARQPEMTPGNMFIFISLVGMFLWPLRHMGRILAEAGRAIVSMSRIGEILDSPVETQPQTGQKLSDTPSGHINISNLSFGFGDDKILDDISLDIPAGQTLGLLGPSGSGKSTLINLLLRIYDYPSGSISLDGVEITKMPRQFVRQQISTVLQEPFLYSRSIGENIRFGRHDSDEHEITDVAIAAAVHDNIESFDDGYETVVGERGVTLSGGQRQRVTIARALLANSPVLILDDALSAVDTATEQNILRALKNRHSRHTTIIIAHRLSTLMHADKIAVLEHSRIAQYGTHAQLVAEDGLYRRLWEIQNSTDAQNANDDNDPIDDSTGAVAK